MNRYTPEERAIIVTMFTRNNSSVVLTQREFRRKYRNRAAPTSQTIRRLAQRFEESGTTEDRPISGRPRSGRSAENIKAVRENILEEPETSTRTRAKQLHISRRSLSRILTLDLAVKPKPPLSAYMLWLESASEQIKKENPGIKDAEVDNKGGEIWRAMKDKSEWEAKAAQTKDNYDEAYRLYNAIGVLPSGSGMKRAKPAKKLVKKSKKADSDDTEEEEESD